MPRDWHPDDDSEDDDWDDAPDEDAAEPEVRCRACGEWMLETSPQCPACGNYPSDEQSPPSSMPAWVRVLALVLAALLIWGVVRGL